MRIAAVIFAISYLVILAPLGVCWYYRRIDRLGYAVRVMATVLLYGFAGGGLLVSLAMSHVGYYYAPYFAGASFFVLLAPIARKVMKRVRNDRELVHHFR